MSLAPRFLQATAISISVPPEIVKSSTISTLLPSTSPITSRISARSSCATPHLVADHQRAFHRLGVPVRLLAEPDVGRGHHKVGDVLAF